MSPFPGTNFYYSTHAYTLLSALIQKAANIEFKQLLNELFKFLDMNESYLGIFFFNFKFKNNSLFFSLDENDNLIANRSKFE